MLCRTAQVHALTAAAQQDFAAAAGSAGHVGRRTAAAAAPATASALLNSVCCEVWPSAVDEEGSVLVNAIYEPPQRGTADSLSLERGTAEEQHADTIARGLGWQKVGCCGFFSSFFSWWLLLPLSVRAARCCHVEGWQRSSM